MKKPPSDGLLYVNGIRKLTSRIFVILSWVPNLNSVNIFSPIGYSYVTHDHTFFYISNFSSMMSRRKRGDRPHISLQPVEMGYVDDNLWNDRVEEDGGDMIPPPENRRGECAMYG